MLRKITLLSGQSKVNVYISILDDTVPREPNIYFFVDIIFDKETLARSVIIIADFLMNWQLLTTMNIAIAN